MERYIYINYAYESRQIARPLIDKLQACGIRVMTGGSEANIAGSSCVLNIHTDASQKSKSYRRVLNYLNRHGKDSIRIHIDESGIRSDIDSQFDLLAALFKYKYSGSSAGAPEEAEESSAQEEPEDSIAEKEAAQPADDDEVEIIQVFPDKEEKPEAGQHTKEDAKAVKYEEERLKEREELYNEGVRILDSAKSEAAKEPAQEQELAVDYLVRSANLGYVPAQYRLSICYDEGTGVARSAAEAAKWREMAAYGGLARAQSEMGYCYEYGQGVVRNIHEAVRWYRIASEQGDAQAKNNLAYCYQKGRGVPKDNNEAIRLYTEASDAGLASAQYNLGYCYWYGEGVETDKQKAIGLFEKSRDGGNARAAQMLKVLAQYEYLHGRRQ